MPSLGIRSTLAAILTLAPIAIEKSGRCALPVDCSTELVTASRQTKKDDGAKMVNSGAATAAESARYSKVRIGSASTDMPSAQGSPIRIASFRAECTDSRSFSPSPAAWNPVTAGTMAYAIGYTSTGGRLKSGTASEV